MLRYGKGVFVEKESLRNYKDPGGPLVSQEMRLQFSASRSQSNMDPVCSVHLQNLHTEREREREHQITANSALTGK